MHSAQELAQLIKAVLHDRLDNSSQEDLAFEVASLRAFAFSTMNGLDHIVGHIERDEASKQQLLDMLHRLSLRIATSIANMDDVRDELKRTHEQNDSP